MKIILRPIFCFYGFIACTVRLASWLPHRLIASVIVLSCVMTLPVASETIRYDGKTAVFQNAPPPLSGRSNTLAPAGYASTSGNILTIDHPAGSEGRDLRYVLGGYSNVSGVAVANNAVDVINGTFRKAMVIGGYHNVGNSEDNAVVVRGGGVAAVMGGVARSGNAARNRISLSGGIVGNVIGGAAQSGNATGNTVSISGGIASNVTGGAARSDNATADTAGSSDGVASNDNNVTLAGGTISGFVLGGLSYSGNATGNIVTVQGGIATGGVIGDSANIESVAELFGGETTHARNTGDIRAGNILHLDNWSGSTQAIVKNFEHYRFTLPAAAANGQSILTLTGDGSVDLSANADIRVAFAGKPTALRGCRHVI
jgi:hypothetical protein